MLSCYAFLIVPDGSYLSYEPMITVLIKLSQKALEFQRIEEEKHCCATVFLPLSGVFEQLFSVQQLYMVELRAA
jgi:hypothetical protein